MITKSEIKRIASLSTSKGRRQTGWFKAEGDKCVADTLCHFELVSLYASEAWIEAHPDKAAQAIVAKRGGLRELSDLVTPPEVLAVYKIPHNVFPDDCARKGLVLALDTIQDPGNLGTIMRVADWFGIHTIIASRETVDMYSPKVVQATMGAISRVKVFYGDLTDTLPALGAEHIWGTFLGGTPIGEAKLSDRGVIVIGNEGKGISPEVEALVTDRLFIPPWPAGAETGESLNAAVATAITIAKFRGI